MVTQFSSNQEPCGIQSLRQENNDPTNGTSYFMPTPKNNSVPSGLMGWIETKSKQLFPAKNKQVVFSTPVLSKNVQVKNGSNGNGNGKQATWTQQLYTQQDKLADSVNPLAGMHYAESLGEIEALEEIQITPPQNGKSANEQTHYSPEQAAPSVERQQKSAQKIVTGTVSVKDSEIEHLFNGAAQTAPNSMFNNQTLPPLVQEIKNNWKLGALVATFVFLAAITYCFVGYKPSYSSSATVLIKDSAMSGRYILSEGGPSESATTSNTTNPILNTLGLLKTDAIRESMWHFMSEKHPEELKKLNINNYSDWAEFFGTGSSLINAKNTAGTDFIIIKFKWSDPRVSKEALTQVLQSLRDASRKLNQAEQHERAEYLAAQIEELRPQLEQIRAQISAFKQETKTVDIGNEREAYARNRIELETTLAQIKSDAASKSNETKEYEQLLGMSSKQAVTASALGGNTSLSKLQETLYGLKEQLKSLKSRYTDQNSKVVQVKQQIVQVESDIQHEMKRTLGSSNGAKSSLVLDKPRGDAITNMMTAKAQAASMSAKAGSLNSYLKELDVKLATLPELEKAMTTLKDQELILSDSLKSLEQKAMEAKIREMQTLSNVFVVETPTAALQATFPRQIHIVIAGFVLALLAGLGSILLKHKVAEKLQPARPKAIEIQNNDVDLCFPDFKMQDAHISNENGPKQAPSQKELTYSWAK